MIFVFSKYFRFLNQLSSRLIITLIHFTLLLKKNRTKFENKQNK